MVFGNDTLGLRFCSSHPPKAPHTHTVCIPWVSSPPKAPYLWDSKVFMPQKTPLLFRFPSIHPQWMSCTHVGPRHKTQPGPRRAGRKPPNHRKSPRRNSTRPAMLGWWWGHPRCTRSDATSSTVQVRSTRPGRVPDSQRPLARHSREGNPPCLAMSRENRYLV